MYDLFIYSLSLIAIIVTIQRLYLAIKLRQEQILAKQSKQLTLSLPVLGVPQSGKTLLLASLSEHLSKHSTNKVNSKVALLSYP